MVRCCREADVKFKFIDWTKPPTLEPFDTIMGAEILFREDLLDPLLSLFDKLLKPGGSIYLTHDLGRKTLYKFLEKAKGRYKIMVKKVELDSGEDKTTVMLNCLKAL